MTGPDGQDKRRKWRNGALARWALLQVLDVSHNLLRVVPADVGWLNLSELRVEGNPDLRIPPIVMQRGFRCGQHPSTQQAGARARVRCRQMAKLLQPRERLCLQAWAPYGSLPEPPCT